MKRKCVVFFSALLVSSMLYATSIDEIFSAAEKNSLTVKNAILTYNNNKLSEKANNVDDKVGVTVSTGNLSYDHGSTNIGLSPSVEVTLPNDGKTVIKAGMGFNAKTDGSLYSYSPSASVSHTFDFSYTSDNLEAYNDSISAIQTESVYYQSLNSFRRSVLNQVKTLLNTELQIKKLEKSISDTETNINNNVELQVYSKNSVTYKKAMLELNKSKASLESTKEQYETAKNRFKTAFGIEWTGLEELSAVSVSFTPSASGNSDVVLSSISAEIASENIKIKESALKQNALRLTGGVNSSIIDTNSVNYSVSPYVNAAYNIDNISLSSSLNASVVNDKFEPALSLAFTWKNKTSDEKDKIELEKLNNSLVKAQNDYQQKLIDYSDSVTALYQKIESYQTSLKDWQINKEYNEELLKLEEELLALGMSTEQKVNDIKFDMECEEAEYQMLCIDGLILNLEIEAMNI